MENLLQLLRDLGSEVVALSLGFGSINDSDGPFFKD
jgi:hypothetical protein